jgi:hypothetical protein
MQDAWVFGITEPQYDCLTIGAFDDSAMEVIKSAKIKHVALLEDFIDKAVFNQLDENAKTQYVRDLAVPKNTTLVTTKREWVPKKSGWMGEYGFGDPRDPTEEFVRYQKFVYKPGNSRQMIDDITAVSRTSYGLLSNVHFKNQGGGTGQSATSWDNTVTFKAGIIAAWSKTTVKPPKEFFEHNKLYNTSDDTIWHANNKSGLGSVKDVFAFKRACEQYGIFLEIETTKNITQVEYLSKFVRVPTAEDSAALKSWRHWKIENLARTGQIDPSQPADVAPFNNPQFVVVQNANAIDLRRTAFRYYQGAAPRHLYTMIERGAGHAQVTAFSPALYQRFAAEWVEDVNTLLRQHKLTPKYELRHDQHGLPCVLQVNPNWKQGVSFSPRQQAVLNWLRGSMFPSYLKVIDIHMNIKKNDPTAHQRFLQKLQRGWRGWDQILRENVDHLFNITDAIPDSWSKKFQTGIDMLYPEDPFHTYNHHTEKFVMTKLLEEYTEEEIDFPLFSMRVQQSPYAGLCNLQYFWQQWMDPNYRETLLRQDHGLYQSMVLYITFLYMTTHFVEVFISTIPYLGPWYRLFIWSFVGINKVYGISNTVYWLATGKSSTLISQLMPKDPYIVAKRVCGFGADLIPLTAGYLLFPITLILNMLPALLELGSRTWKKGLQIKETKQNNTDPENPWSAYASDYVERLRALPKPRAYVAAPMASGKTTFFPSAIWAQRAHLGVGKLWIISPRKILRDEWSIPFRISSQILKADVNRSKIADIYLCTYGHFLVRMHECDPTRDIVFFDEFHELTGEMLLAETYYKGPIFLMSGTPVNIPQLEGTPMYRPAGIRPRFKLTIRNIPEQKPVDAYQRIQVDEPELAKRCMIVVPTISQVDKTLEGLRYLKVPCSEVSRRQRTVAPTGVLVCTPYVETGLDMKPSCPIQLDCGRATVIDRGVHVKPHPWTCPDTSAQRNWRVGRSQNGIVYRMGNAGKGPTPVIYPAGQMFQHRVISDHFKVGQLTPVRNPFCMETPFLGVNHNVCTTKASQKSVVAIHALALSGVRFDELEKFYCQILRRSPFNEDQWWLKSILNNRNWRNTPLLDWDQASCYASRTDSVYYGISGETTFKRPIYPVMGHWQEEFTDPVLQEDLKGHDVENKRRFNVVKVVEKLTELQDKIMPLLSVSHDPILSPEIRDLLKSIHTSLA